MGGGISRQKLSWPNCLQGEGSKGQSIEFQSHHFYPRSFICSLRYSVTYHIHRFDLGASYLFSHVLQTLNRDFH